jgi:hypothetical protein
MKDIDVDATCLKLLCEGGFNCQPRYYKRRVAKMRPFVENYGIKGVKLVSDYNGVRPKRRECYEDFVRIGRDEKLNKFIYIIAYKHGRRYLWI